MHKGNITALILALIIAVPAAMAQSSSCTSVTPSNNAFTAALVGSGISGSPNGFGGVNLSFSGTQATVNARSLGLGNNITGITLFQGTPGGGAPLVILGSNATANNGHLIGTTNISNTLAQQLLANPCSFTLSLSTPAFPNGAVIGALAAANEVFIPVAGSASGANGTHF